MGFDVNGLAPATERGKYFRNSVWWWRPLWKYIYAVCPGLLSKEDFESGMYNDFHKISANTARAVGERMLREVESGQAAAVVRIRDEYLSALPMVRCNLCGGSGRREDAIAQQNGIKVCNGCNGAGKRPDDETHYHLDVENVRKFAEFAIESGGFEIG